MGEKILIIDDEANLRKTLAEILQRRGYATLKQRMVRRHLELLRNVTPDLNLQRLEDAQSRGEELLQQLRSDPRTLSIPVIVITAFGSSHSAIEAVRLGAYDFVTKPFDLEEIALTAKRALAHAALNRELKELKAHVASNNGAIAGRLIGSSSAMMDVFKIDRKSWLNRFDGSDLRRIRNRERTGGRSNS